jgi:hypothetical protein
MCRESRPVSRLPVWRRCRLDFTVVEKDGCADGVDGFATDDPRDIDRITSLVQVLPTCAVVLAVQLGHALASAASPSAIGVTVPYTMPLSMPRAARTSCTPRRSPCAHAHALQFLHTRDRWPASLSSDDILHVRNIIAVEAAPCAVASRSPMHVASRSLTRNLGFVWLCYQRAK